MKLREIYEQAVRLGIEADVQGGSGDKTVIGTESKRLSGLKRGRQTFL